MHWPVSSNNATHDLWPGCGEQHGPVSAGLSGLMVYFVAQVIMAAIGTHQRFDDAVLGTFAPQIDPPVSLEGRAGQSRETFRAQRAALLEDLIRQRVGREFPRGPAPPPDDRRPATGATPQGKHGRQHQGRPLIAGPAQKNPFFRPNEFRGKPKQKIGHQIQPHQIAAEDFPPRQLIEDDGGRQMKGCLVKLRRMPPLSVAEIDSPGQRSHRAVAATGVKAAETADADSSGHGGREYVAQRLADAQRPFGQFGPDVSADQSGENCLAVVKPGGAAQKTLPIGQDEGKFCADHAAAEGPQCDGGDLPKIATPPGPLRGETARSPCRPQPP